MKMYFQRLLVAALVIFSLQHTSSYAQVMNPADPVVEYTGGNLQQPPFGQIADWVKTSRLNWSTDDFKAYIYKGQIFRLKFPTSYQHNVNDGKKYPIFVFFHGLGEAASPDGESFNLYDNEFHLLHGGQRHKDYVVSGKFDGFLLYMQNQFGFYGTVHHDAIAEIIQNFLVPQNKGDIDRVIVNGLSAGGGATWDFTIRYPRLVAGCLPISAAAPYVSNSANILRYIPIWHFQGGRDRNPLPATSEAVGQAILNAGGSYRYTLYPTLGHGVWNNAWTEPDYLPFLNSLHKANPVPLYTKHEFCVGEAPNVTLGLSAGFAEYQWRRNGVVISGATGNTYNVTQYGTYDARFRRTAGGAWSEWSPKPIVVKLKDPTIPPDITTKGLMSKVIPAPDGNNGVTLSQPEGYLTYSWTRVGSSTVLSTADTLRATTAGDYVVKVTEPFGCLSEFSAPFTVINANGPNKPSPASNVVATPISRTQMKLDWVENPAPPYNETNFEIYQSRTAGGPYTLVGITGADVTTFTVNGLSEGTRYFYIIRAVNNTGASTVTTEVSASTIPDNEAPSAPVNLRVASSTTNSVSLDWDNSTDNVGVIAYDIYINGLKSYVTTGTNYTCYNLTVADSGYVFVVKARDDAGNISLPSNQVYGIPPSNVQPAPFAPTNITATTVTYKRIDLSWTDNSNNETHFEILRSTNAASGFALIGKTNANVTSYVDSVGLNPSTTYYYRVSAAHGQGASAFMKPTLQANWKFDNNLNDASGNNKTLSASGTTYNSADKIEGTHAVSFNGTSSYINVNTGSNDYLRGGYGSKTVAFWMKSNANTGMRIIADLGGSDDGIALGLESNMLIAGIASNNVRRAIMAPYSSNAWNHIAVIYNGSAFRLYVNGIEVASNTNLGFTSVGTTSNASRLGTTNSSNSFNQGTGYFSGLLDDFNIFETALSQEDLLRLASNTPIPDIPQGSATTAALPAKPAIPTNLLATATGTSTVNVSWTDVATDETRYEVYRSYGNASNYVLIKKLAANANSFNDAGLYATSVVYYKVQAVNASGSLGFSNQDSARTFTEVPVLNSITNQYMRYGTQLQVDVTASTPLSSGINISISNLPSFGSYSPNGNGTGVLTFNPSIAQQGTYPNITITATDDFGGSSQVSFQLVVNSNYNPVLAPISNVTVNESATQLLNLSSTDQNAGDVLSYSFTGLPSFVTVTPNGNNAQLSITPGYADHGVYNLIARVEDNNNGFHTRSFNITVNDINPTSRIYVNFTDGSLGSPSPWNGTNKAPQLNDNFPSLLDENGVTTSIGLSIVSPWGSIGNGSNTLGVNTNSGVYPNAVIRSAYWTNTTPQTIRINGLDPARQYTFTFFGSRDNVNDNRTSVYTINGNSVSLNAANNSNNTVSLTGLTPAADGTLELTLSNGAGSSFAYLNAMIIESVFDDGSAPAQPRNLAAQAISGGVRLTWIDAAYNESAYQIWRSDAIDGVYQLLNPGGANSRNTEVYNDNTVAGNTTYYYRVRAVNSVGNSPYTDIVEFTTGNGIPVMNVLPNVTLRIQETEVININVNDDEGDVITLSATNLPFFATLVDNGDGTGSINIAPGANIGIYNNITVTARDDKGATTSRSFRIVVRDVFNSVYVNFSNSTAYPAPSPWNSFTSVPFQGKQLTNLIDDSETPTGISILQVNSWEGGNDQGATTGLGTGVYPDNVMKTVYYQSSNEPMVIRISGLNPVNTKYNLVFFASRLAGDVRTTRYTANGVSVVLNAANNTQNTVQINGLTPNANGVIEFTCTKEGTSPYAYLGALVIQSYVDNGLPFAPSSLKALAKSKTAIQLTWTDKSSDEDGFEVYRAESFVGPYTLIATTAPNATSYTDATGLQTAKVYYYRVRGKKGDIYSDFTNVANTSTFMFSLYMNFNRSNNAPSPWFNTARAPEEGRVFSNIRNDLGNFSGMNMTVVDNFSGDNPSGMNTGNNSGVFPDNVLRSSWWVDAGIVAKLKISNLNKNWSYSFVFTGSRNGGGDRTSIYTINGKSVSLNASYNTTQTVQIDDVKPDDNGEVEVTVALSQYAMFAYLNAMVIHGYKEGENGDPADIINPPLTANAGPDKEITLPVNSVQLNGTAQDGNGSTMNYSWAQTSGPAQYTITNGNTASPTISNLAEGTYTFQMTVTDDLGATDTDDVTVVVYPASANTAPTANAGTDIEITMPTNSVQLNGSGTDANGTIVSYAWVRTAGPTQFTITDGNTASPTLSNLTDGTYTFQLTVTDNQGATAFDEVNVVVNPFTGPRMIKVNMVGGLNHYNNPEWNNWNSVANWTSQSFNYSDGTASGVGAVISHQSGMSDNGATYTMSMAPNEVGRYASYSTVNRTMTFSGLNPARTYNLEIYASRSGTTVNSTRFTIGGNSVDIATSDNSANVAAFSSLTPTASGTLVLNIDRLNTYSYINGFILTENPATTITARIVTGSEVTESEVQRPDSYSYPNPFRDHVVVGAEFESAQDKVILRMVDVSGRVIHTQFIGQVPKGKWNYRLNLANQSVEPGVYILQIVTADLKVPPVNFKLLKTE